MELSRRTVMASAAAAGVAATALGGTAHASGSTSANASGSRKPVKESFGKLADGTKVYRWSLENGGTRLKVLNYGGIVQSLELPDRHGRYVNVSSATTTSRRTSPGTRSSAPPSAATETASPRGSSPWTARRTRSP